MSKTINYKTRHQKLQMRIEKMEKEPRVIPKFSILLLFFRNFQLYSQVYIKQARLLNYFEEIFHPARTYESPARLTILDKKVQNCFLYSFF